MLARALLACPHADVVFSTNWRINASPEYLVNLLPPEVQDRVAGVTGVVDGQRFELDLELELELECREYAEKYGVVQFVAVDDDAKLFSPGYHFLFKTDRHDGLNDDAGALLSTWINSL